MHTPFPNYSVTPPWGWGAAVHEEAITNCSEGKNRHPALHPRADCTPDGGEGSLGGYSLLTALGSFHVECQGSAAGAQMGNRSRGCLLPSRCGGRGASDPTEPPQEPPSSTIALAAHSGKSTGTKSTAPGKTLPRNHLDSAKDSARTTNHDKLLTLECKIHSLRFTSSWSWRREY